MDKNWTIPNLLTIGRILVTPAFIAAVAYDRIMLAWWLFFLAGITDGLDGFLARVLKQRSKLGAMIDPLADKILLMTAFITLGAQGWVPLWLVILVVSRDVIIMGGLALLQFWSVAVQNVIQPTWVSKANTAAQILLIFLVMYSRASGWEAPIIEDVLIILVGLLTVVSGLHYVHRGFSLFPQNEGHSRK